MCLPLDLVLHSCTVIYYTQISWSIYTYHAAKTLKSGAFVVTCFQPVCYGLGIIWRQVSVFFCRNSVDDVDICIYIYICMYIDKYPQTGTFADPETHPLRAFVPFLPRAVLALGPFLFFLHFWTHRLLLYILETETCWYPCSKCYGMDCFGTYFTHVQTCNVTRVQSATEWTASVHTLHMPKPNVTRVQSATQWTASVHTLHMPKHVM